MTACFSDALVKTMVRESKLGVLVLVGEWRYVPFGLLLETLDRAILLHAAICIQPGSAYCVLRCSTPLLPDRSVDESASFQ